MRVTPFVPEHQDYESSGQLAAATGSGALFKLMLSFQTELDPLSQKKRVVSPTPQAVPAALPNDYRSIPLTASLTATAWTSARQALENGYQHARLALYAHPQPLIDSTQIHKIPVNVVHNCGLAARMRLVNENDQPVEEDSTLLHDIIPQAEAMGNRLAIPH